MADSLSSKIEELQRDLEATATYLEKPPTSDYLLGRADGFRKVVDKLTPLQELAKEMERAIMRAKPDNYGDPLVKIAQDLKKGASE